MVWKANKLLSDKFIQAKPSKWLLYFNKYAATWNYEIIKFGKQLTTFNISSLDCCLTIFVFCLLVFITL